LLALAMVLPAACLLAPRTPNNDVPARATPTCHASRERTVRARAGWGNLGGGATQLLMPLVYDGMTHLHSPFIAWRWAFFVPGFMHILGGMLILFFSTDLPDGNYALLKKSGGLAKDNGGKVMWNALRNYRCAAGSADTANRARARLLRPGRRGAGPPTAGRPHPRATCRARRLSVHCARAASLHLRC
jgi:hypothetical protein